ncbi:MAG TPA: hypothetical protein VGJ71_14220 [Candidatus Limnocylindrales bacterium]
MEHEAFEGLTALWHDQQTTGRPAGDERLLDRAASGDELFVLTEEVGGCDCWRRGEPRRRLAPGTFRARARMGRGIAPGPCGTAINGGSRTAGPRTERPIRAMRPLGSIRAGRIERRSEWPVLRRPPPGLAWFVATVAGRAATIVEPRPIAERRPGPGSGASGRWTAVVERATTGRPRPRTTGSSGPRTTGPLAAIRAIGPAAAEPEPTPSATGARAITRLEAIRPVVPAARA